MLRFNYCINLALATLLVVPAVTLGVQRNEPLEKTLGRTLSALDQLAQVEGRLRQRDPTAVERVLQLTEKPTAVPDQTPQARDEELERLHHEVQALRGLLNDFEDVARVASRPREFSTGTGSGGATSAHSTEPPTTGLEPQQLRAFARPVLTSVPTAAATDPKKSSGTPTAKVSLESDHYSSDALKLGRAFYKQGQYDKAREQLAALPSSAEACYWLARSLEKLGRESEAAEQYQRLVERTDAGSFGERARADLELLQWRQTVEKTAKAPVQEKP
jgi:TolA-binding protein